MLVSVTEAAKVAGCARSTIYDKINNGELSRSAGGKIDTAELLRVFGELQTPTQQQADDKPSASLQTQPDIVLSAELLDMVQAKDEQLANIRKELDDAKERLQEHREAARALVDPETFEAKQREWEAALSERQAEIKQARAEADELRQKQTVQADALKREQAKARALQSRGLIARLLNKPVTG